MLIRSKEMLIGLALALGAVACSDDSESKPPVDEKPSFTADAEVDAGPTAPDAEVVDPNFASKAEAEKEGWAEGCFKGTPKTNDELLNACAKGFRTFDTKNYPTSWKPDELPALP